MQSKLTAYQIHGCRIRQYKRYPTIGDFERYESKSGLVFQLDTDSDSVRQTFDDLGYHPRQEIDGLFVCVGDGDYREVWGFTGCVPYTHRAIYRIL